MQENNDEPQTSAAVHGAEASGYSHQKFPDLRTYYIINILLYN